MSEQGVKLYEAATWNRDGSEMSVEVAAREAAEAIAQRCASDGLVLVGIDDCEVVHTPNGVYHRITVGCLPASGRAATSLAAARAVMTPEALRRLRREVVAL